MHIHMKNQSITYSQHFLNDRMHRGIGEDVIQTILEMGEFKYDKHNGKIYYLGDKSFHNMKRAGMSKQDIEYYRKKRAVQIVVSMDGVLITAMYANSSRTHLH
ncbi:hypothetical protein [Polynucleobacter sphagniphilus]|uniref:DUF4258 domain-containing protein n=1 Tax=Polynucleobacter sphagniphilus TaxID=1743169 RepID=A0AA43MA44_9BURK|nr:hypothetical protein [Polynucleobacter sphagniphilus]MDH6504795.1 hypothetical protein [Polynucleobacter sphagniphilus]MDH6512935.1 hypothetical protein [Polynucleobacter sphagniphilus]